MDGRKHTVIEIGGRIYNLRLSYNALCMFEENVGPITQMLRGTIDTKNLLAYRGLVWVAINAYGNQQVTFEQAGDLCEEYITAKGFDAFAREMKRLIDECGWLKQKGADMGNQTPTPNLSPSES